MFGRIRKWATALAPVLSHAMGHIPISSSSRPMYAPVKSAFSSSTRTKWDLIYGCQKTSRETPCTKYQGTQHDDTGPCCLHQLSFLISSNSLKNAGPRKLPSSASSTSGAMCKGRCAARAQNIRDLRLILLDFAICFNT